MSTEKSQNRQLKQYIVPVSIAGVIIYLLSQFGPPEDAADLGIYLAVVAVGMVAWLIQAALQVSDTEKDQDRRWIEDD